MKASIRFDHQLLAVEGEHTVHGMLELVAPPAKGDKDRAPLHLAVVIDRSGSMAGPKLDHTKEAAAFLVRRLAKTDEIALVTYDDSVELISSLGTADHDALCDVISQIYPGGSTNLSGGWLKGLEEVRRAKGDGVRKVLLLTDGLANVGVIDPPSLTKMAENARGDSVGTSTIGFGHGFNEELLTEMAAAGGGNSYFVESPEDAPKVFAEEFEGLTQLVAQNVSVEIRPTEEVKLLGILNQYPATEVVGGIQLALGDAYGDEMRRVIFELHIPEMAKLGVAKVADIVVRYVAVGDTVEAHEITIPVTVNMVTADEASKADPDNDVIEEVLILKSAQAQREARERSDRGDFGGAQALLKNAAVELREMAPLSKRSEELLEEAERLTHFHDMQSPANWDESSRKAMHYDEFRKRQSRRRPRPDDQQ